MLRNSMSSTRKFFRRTLVTLKSLFSENSYVKLPKSPPEKSFQGDQIQCNSNDTTIMVIGVDISTNRTEKTSSISSETNSKKKKKTIKRKIGSEIAKEDSSGVRVVEKYVLVEKKLKELEMLDMSNVDHALDIEEVLHYYSRLTCPAYLEIVDSFFVDFFSEFFGSSAPIRSIDSGLRLNMAKI